MDLLAGFPAGFVIGGEYVIERALSAGGMGRVFVARQQSTNRVRALKLMPREIVSDPKSHEGFLREAKVASLIESDHVVEVVGAGIDAATGVPWLAMELLEGQELAAHVEARGRLPTPDAVRILEELFHAMRAAHRAGVVHRDLKPENLFLRTTRQVGSACMLKVLDFGIAKILSTSGASKLTRSIGTPGWMAPEQCSTGTCGPASDVWALGLLAFYILTGKPFWLRFRDESLNINALLYEICLAPVPASSVRAAELGAPGSLPPGFDAWFARAVEREPERRFANATEAWTALEPLLAAMIRPSSDSLARQSAADISPAAAYDPTVLPEAAVETVSSTAPLTSFPDPAAPRASAAASIPATVPMLPEEVARPAETLDDPMQGAESAARLPTTGGGVATQSVAAAPRRRTAARVAAIVVVVGLGSIAAIAALVRLPRSSPTEVAPQAVIEAARSRAEEPPAASAPKGSLAAPASDMVNIPGGRITVDGEERSINFFQLDRHEVTVEAWDACFAAGICDQQIDAASWTAVARDKLVYFSGLCNHRDRKERARHPVNCVSYEQANTYCTSFAKKRLPTRYEWQFAAFGTRKLRKYPWGDAPADPQRLNVCGIECARGIPPLQGSVPLEPFLGRKEFDDGAASTARVGAYPRGATPEGAMDLAGNVWEWTSTPAATEKGAFEVVGGGWYETDASMIERGASASLRPEVRFPTLGFRCVR